MGVRVTLRASAYAAVLRAHASSVTLRAPSARVTLRAAYELDRGAIFDAAGSSDAAVVLQMMRQIASDLASMVDEILDVLESGTQGYVESPSDAMTATDAVATLQTMRNALAMTADASDEIVAQVLGTNSEAPMDVATVTDSVFSVQTMLAALGSDTATVSDAITFLQIAIDQATATDAIVSGILRSDAAPDSATMTDALVAAQTMVQVLADTATVTDAETHAITPAVPAFTAPGAGASISGPFTVSGTEGTVGSTIHVLVNGVEVGTAPETGGTWTLPGVTP